MTYGRALKPRACRTCRKQYSPRNSFQTCCSPLCALSDAKTHSQSLENVARRRRNEVERQSRRETRVALSKLMTRRDWTHKAQTALNKYCRLRDINAGHTCICCHRNLLSSKTGGGVDCGHYRSVGSAPHLRFNPDNAHAQTKFCNRWGSGRAVDYRIGLIKRIGLSRVEALESDQTPRKFTIEQLQEIIEHYNALTKGLTHE